MAGVPTESAVHDLTVTVLDPNCLMLLVEGDVGAEVTMRAEPRGPYLGTVRLFRDGLGEPMIRIADLEGPSPWMVAFLASVERIVIL